jgi:hypothetical protein
VVEGSGGRKWLMGRYEWLKVRVGKYNVRK